MKKYWLILAITAICVFLAVVISYITKPPPRKPKLTIEEKIAAVEVDLKTLDLTLGDYFSTHNTFPGDLISLTTPIAFISTLTVDPFNLDRRPVGKGENPYKFLKQGEGETVEVTLYSYGPDTDDDNARGVYDPLNGTTSNGDIVRRVLLPPEGVAKVTADRNYLFENQQISRASDDNGIIEFMMAMKKAKFDPKNAGDSAALDSATTVILEGWKGELGHLDAVLESNQQAFEHIHAGAKKPYARSIIVEKELDFLSYYPNFFIMFPLSKLMIAEGKKFEAEGNPERAIHNYIDSIKLGQSVGNGVLIGKLTDMAVEGTTYKALRAAITNGQLGSEYLEDLIEELEKLEQSSPPLAIAFWHERLVFIQGIQKECTVKNFLKSSKAYGAHKTLPSYLYLLFNKHKVVENGAKLFNELISYSKKLYPEAISYNIASRLKKTDPITKMCIPKFFEPLIRETKKKTYAQGVRIMAALELFKSRNNTYPATIDELSANLKPIPLDPFTEKSFRYEKVGDIYRLYSAGPDMHDDFGALLYDPTNGTESTGDIIFRE